MDISWSGQTVYYPFIWTFYSLSSYLFVYIYNSSLFNQNIPTESFLYIITESLMCPHIYQPCVNLHRGKERRTIDGLLYLGLSKLVTRKYRTHLLKKHQWAFQLQVCLFWQWKVSQLLNYWPLRFSSQLSGSTIWKLLMQCRSSNMVSDFQSLYSHFSTSRVCSCLIGLHAPISSFSVYRLILQLWFFSHFDICIWFIEQFLHC